MRTTKYFILTKDTGELHLRTVGEEAVSSTEKIYQTHLAKKREGDRRGTCSIHNLAILFPTYFQHTNGNAVPPIVVVNLAMLFPAYFQHTNGNAVPPIVVVNLAILFPTYFQHTNENAIPPIVVAK